MKYMKLLFTSILIIAQYSNVTFSFSTHLKTFHKSMHPKEFRKSVRSGKFRSPTNGICSDYLQCNLVVLREKDAFDFLKFCDLNSKACPLIEVLDVGSSVPKFCSSCADLKTDIPKYRIFQNGILTEEVTDVKAVWPDDAVAFLIGCSFSCDAALMNAGIELRSIQQKKNVPMYNTNLECTPVGSFAGNVVVSMKPIKALDVAKEVQITSKFPKAHGGPICVGCPTCIGITDISKPDYGDPVDIYPDEVPVFHACGVTPQNIIMKSQVEFAITHSPGHMFITDLKSDFDFSLLPSSSLSTMSPPSERVLESNFVEDEMIETDLTACESSNKRKKRSNCIDPTEDD